MKSYRTLLAAVLCCVLEAGHAMAASPLPVFDKEAVTVHPYNRTGEQTVTAGAAGESYRPGNTGSAEAPAFYVKQIRIDGLLLRDSDGDLKSVLSAYEGRSVETAELDTLMAQITHCYKKAGFTVAQAVLPPQEVKDGILHVTVYTARYDTVGVTKNDTDVTDNVLRRYTRKLHAGDVITDRQLENAMNLLNDLPAVQARAVLRPGSAPGTTAVDIEAVRRPVWNNYVFVDNGGGYYSGRWRTGIHTEINNPGHIGDKITVTGMITEEHTKNYGIRYETPLGPNGTRVGAAYSRSSYDFMNAGLNSLGQSRGYSLYGMTPLYRDMTDRVTLIYGYDRRKITDRVRFGRGGERWDFTVADKRADVWHAGISGSQYDLNQFIQYSLIYWYGTMKYEGGQDRVYQKLTGDLLDVIYDGKWNYRLQLSGQLANTSLDGSEQFYLGGMNGVRAYGASDGYGDYGYLASAEIRRQTDVKGLEAALFIDNGVAVQKEGHDFDHLSGWGVGLRYSRDNDWYAQLDLAWKIDGRPDRTEPHDHGQRIWFQLYKMF